MVCVTKQLTCERLIKRGSNLKGNKNGDLFVIHVAKEGVNFLGNKKEAEALEYLFTISKEVGANLTVIRANDVVEAISNFAKDNTIKYIVLGAPPKDTKDDGIISRLQSTLSECEFLVIPEEEL